MLGVAHVHAGSYASALGNQLCGVFDDVPVRAEAFASKWHTVSCSSAVDAATNCDAVVICSETSRHLELIGLASGLGKPILCEKPIAITRDEGERIRAVVKDNIFMTAFPCRFAPAWDRVLQRVQGGEIGEIVSISATNHGRCAGGWFLEKDKGGGAILDHVVHVADLIRSLMDEEPIKASAATGKGMHQTEVEDIAMITYDLPNGCFVTVDSSWSRPHAYRTWGDVTLNIVGQNGLIEVDLFAQEIDVYQEEPQAHRVAGYGSHLDGLMLREFLNAVQHGRTPKVTLEDGLAANAWAWMALDSMAKGGEPVVSA